MSKRVKVRFIEPQGRPGRPFNAWIRRWPLLGPITLATILRDRGHDVAVYNENLSGSLFDSAEAYEDICSADIVGISIMTPTANRGYTIADRIRREAPSAKVVLGGVHASFLPQETLAHGDVVVCGEGETVIESIVSGEIERGIVHAPPLEDLDSIPTLDHSLMWDFDRLLVSGRHRELYELPVMTSRGCPYGCTYCSVTRMFGRKVRRQSVEKVHQDIRRHADNGFRQLFFYDDNFITDRQWARSLLERLRPMRMRFNAQARVDFHWLDAGRRNRDERLLRLIRQAGGNVLYVGYETVEDSTAQEWRKGYRGAGALTARLREDTRILHDSGFWIHGMFILGPQHTRETAAKIVKFARRNHIESLQISILTPVPGTSLFEQMRQHLIFTNFPADWDYYDGAHCVYNHGRLSVEELQNTVLDAHRRFYRWGGWSLRRLKAMMRQPIPLPDRLAELWSNARVARTTLRQWRKEINSFLDVAKNRTEIPLPRADASGK
jgi:radical SAM superfamily enzyme YgiQ (UPF0313 family)